MSPALHHRGRVCTPLEVARALGGFCLAILLCASPLSAAEPEAALVRHDANAARCSALLDRLESGEDTIETCNAISEALRSPLTRPYRESVVFPRLLAMRSSPHAKVRQASNLLLHTHPLLLSNGALAEYLRHEDATVRLLAVKSPQWHGIASDGEAERAATIGLLLPLLEDRDPAVAEAAMQTLLRIDDKLTDPRVRAADERHAAREIEAALRLIDERGVEAVWRALGQSLNVRLLRRVEDKADAEPTDTRQELMRQSARLAFHLGRETAQRSAQPELTTDERNRYKERWMDAWYVLLQVMRCMDDERAKTMRAPLYEGHESMRRVVEAEWLPMLLGPPFNLTRAELGLPPQ